MVILVPAALPTSTAPYAAVLAVGFLVGIAGHMSRSRTLVVVGILMVGAAAVLFTFVVGKVGQ